MLETQLVPKFSLGTVSITENARAALAHAEADVRLALRRHASGDWGENRPKGVEENDAALRSGERVISIYRTRDNICFWILTSGDRSVTRISLPGHR